MDKSNVTLKSNVYIVSTVYPFEDKTFISKVTDLKALEKIRNMRHGNVAMHDLQYALLNRGMNCSVHDEYERPFGLVAKEEGHVFECRCSMIHKCPYAAEGKCWDIYRG
ncbi:hypothetical protein [Geobacter sulfurreducens]|uniref:hypothetical protein n=1 Tax=Geobacter sulfurreducens TaxID=35554 RepID=UPI002CDF913C|nr:hypothetical protein [Geobacter sulfurreducens]HML78997.1 hypothetical protein [Geobacter sulfurreducens]